jgi:hypothetical protein
VIELNDVDRPLQDIKYMAEIAAELVNDLDSNDARAGFFQISHAAGNRLAFACNDTLRRIEELLASLSAAGNIKQSMGGQS